MRETAHAHTSRRKARTEEGEYDACVRACDRRSRHVSMLPEVVLLLEAFD